MLVFGDSVNSAEIQGQVQEPADNRTYPVPYVAVTLDNGAE